MKEKKVSQVEKNKQKKETQRAWQTPQISTFKFAGCCLNGPSGS